MDRELGLLWSGVLRKGTREDVPFRGKGRRAGKATVAPPRPLTL